MAGNNARSFERTADVRARPPLRDISYFTARAVEELDRAEAATDDNARLVHQRLATNYLEAALRLRDGANVRIATTSGR